MPALAVKYLPHDEELALDGFVWVHYGDYNELRTFVAAQTVRADILAKALQPFADAALESRDNWRKQDGQMAELGIPRDADCAVSFTQGQLDDAEAALDAAIAAGKEGKS